MQVAVDTAAGAAREAVGCTGTTGGKRGALLLVECDDTDKRLEKVLSDCSYCNYDHHHQ